MQMKSSTWYEDAARTIAISHGKPLETADEKSRTGAASSSHFLAARLQRGSAPPFGAAASLTL
jgi:hypothetical protein